MHAYRPAAGPARTKLLYLFRSPAHIQIGRKPLDPEVREALEHTHPDLTFDWNGLLRDAPPVNRQPREERERGRDRDRQSRGARPQKAARVERPAAPVREVPDDDTPLGQAVGAAEAARLRHRYAELAQRIARRARTPEERDRLTAELAAVNPDQWVGPEAIRAQARGADRAWDAVAAQLPKRRRGRRGGRADGNDQGDGPDQTGAGDVIIGERDNTDERISEDPPRAAGADGAGDGDPERSAGAAPDAPSAPAGPDDSASDIR